MSDRCGIMLGRVRMKMAEEEVGVSASEKYFGERGRDLRRSLQRRTFQVQKLWDTHKEVIRQSVLGLKGSEIADSLGVSKAMVSYTLNSPVAKAKKAILEAERDANTVDLAKRIREFAPKCVDYLEKIVLGEEAGVTHGLRVGTAKDMLDRGGYVAVRKLQVASTHLTRQDLEDIKERARMGGIVRAEVVNEQAR